VKRIPVSGPSITEKEIAYVTDAVTNCWYENANLYHERFERAFAAYIGTKHAIALPSCTSALHLSLLAYGVGKGDEVIVPDCTWIATAAPVSYVGADLVLADMDPHTWCISAESFAACITKRTKAVIPVDLYGNMPDMDAIRSIADRHGIKVIEDSAEAIGARYRGKPAGSFGDVGVFSFHGSKTITTYEGGMLVTNDSVLHQRALFLRDHGRKPNDRYFFNAEVAQKYKMSSMQAALGLAQIERIEEIVARKREIFAWYREALAGVAGVTINAEAPETRNTFWMVTVILDPRFGLRKERLMDLMAEAQVDCRPFFYPLSLLPAYAGTKIAKLATSRNLVSHRLSPYGINLPSGLNLTKELVVYVVDALKRILALHPKA
jgi:perosamine synthetase